jgi:hypothetical protein
MCESALKLSYLEATSVRPSVHDTVPATKLFSVAVYLLLYRYLSESREVPAVRFNDSRALTVGVY